MCPNIAVHVHTWCIIIVVSLTSYHAFVLSGCVGASRSSGTARDKIGLIRATISIPQHATNTYEAQRDLNQRSDRGASLKQCVFQYYHIRIMVVIWWPEGILASRNSLPTSCLPFFRTDLKQKHTYPRFVAQDAAPPNGSSSGCNTSHRN